MLKETVKALCKQRGITVQKLEKEVGLSNGTISKWDKAKPTVESLTKVANYFGITVIDILDMTVNGDELKKSDLVLEIERQQDNHDREIMLTLHIDPQNKKAKELIEAFNKLSDKEKNMVLEIAKHMALGKE